jgi:hypothetical protein
MINVIEASFEEYFKKLIEQAQNDKISTSFSKKLSEYWALIDNILVNEIKLTKTLGLLVRINRILILSHFRIQVSWLLNILQKNI